MAIQLIVYIGCWLPAALWPGERERTESFGWDHHFAEFYSQTTAARYIFNVTDCERRRIGFMAGEKPF
jgi:hypothetical protein